MTVSTDNRKIQYETNGTTTEFSFDFVVASKDDIYCFLVDDEGNETAYTNFTVLLNEDNEGGAVTTNDTLDDTDLLIYRDTPLNQEVDLITGGRFPAETIERSLDKLTLQQQEQQEQLSRAITAKASSTETYVIGTLIDGNNIKLLNGEIVSSDFSDSSLIAYIAAQNYTKTQSDDRFLNSAGDTATGNIGVPNAVLGGHAVPLTQVASLIQAQIGGGVSPIAGIVDYGPVTGTVGFTASQMQIRRGTTEENNAFSGAIGELTLDVDLKNLRIGDGSTAGGKIIPNKDDVNLGVFGDEKYKGAYSSLVDELSLSVQAGDKVSHDGALYVARSSVLDISTDAPTANSSSWVKLHKSIFEYLVSQFAYGDESLVGYIQPGEDSTEFLYYIEQSTGMAFYQSGVTGAFSDPLDFDSDTGIDSGLSGSMSKILAIREDRVAAIESGYTDNELSKTDKFSRALELDGSDIKAKQDFYATINGTRYKILSGTVAPAVTLTSATDYKVYALTDSSLLVQDFDTAAPANSCLVGGFHAYHTAATCNPYSIWDQGWRPRCFPRAMTQTIGATGYLWADIYLADVEYGLNGYSRGDQTIADDGNPPIIPAIYGGSGVTTYGSLTWFEAWDLAISAGKRLPFWGEFTGLAYGVVEQQSVGSDPVTTKYQAGSRSACGMEQATGVMYQWGADVQANLGGGWAAITDGRGSVYNSGISAVLLGAYWGDGSIAGSRSAGWSGSPCFSYTNIGLRAVCDHMIL